MALDYGTLDLLRQNHPAWRLLRAQHAPLVASFLQRVFVEPNVRKLSQADLVEALEDELFVLREQRGAETFPGTALGYLNDWAENDKGWLRKFYPEGTDEPHFDLTPATEKALAWLKTVASWTSCTTSRTAPWPCARFCRLGRSCRWPRPPPRLNCPWSVRFTSPRSSL